MLWRFMKFRSHPQLALKSCFPICWWSLRHSLLSRTPVTKEPRRLLSSIHLTNALSISGYVTFLPMLPGVYLLVKLRFCISLSLFSCFLHSITLFRSTWKIFAALWLLCSLAKSTTCNLVSMVYDFTCFPL